MPNDLDGSVMKNSSGAGIGIDTGRQGLPPSQKQLDFMASLSGRTGTPIPDEARASGRAAAEWIDAILKSGTLPPSEKQTAFAKELQRSTGLALPEEALKDARKLSAWIDQARSAQAPSEKQVQFATELAAKKNLELPPDILASRVKLGQWLDRYAPPKRGEKQDAKGKAAGRATARGGSRR